MKMAKPSSGEIDALVDMFNALANLLDYGDRDHTKIKDIILDHWNKVGPGWRRVVLGCHTLLKNCADPDNDTLEFKPELLLAMKEAPNAPTEEEYRVLLNLAMVSDPWPLDEGEDKTFQGLLNRGAKSRGYTTWIEAYHEHNRNMKPVVEGPGAEVVQAVIDTRHEFILAYMKERGWGTDMGSLSMEQTLEIRKQPGWKEAETSATERAAAYKERCEHAERCR
jgi:hypothetical protein